MNRPYFREPPDAPPPLSLTVERVVRFEEVDPLGIVWHGRYASYFEDARVALGERYAIGYMDFRDQGVLTPIRKLHLDYVRPLAFRDRFTIEGLLHWSEAARLNYEFILRNGEGEITTTGYTVQMMMDRQNRVALAPPAFYLDFLTRWRQGKLS